MSTLLEELNKNKVIEDAVQPNKMSKFAYTEQAYEDNNAAGVDSFNFEEDQNIPSDKLSVLQTNETVILKGFRAQASSVTRQLLNHFFGRASYNLNKVHDVVKGVLDAFVNFIGKANGIATLDENGRIPYSQLPESAMEFKGTWNASTNTPTLADGTGDTGDFYVVSVAGTQDLGSGEIKFLENDRVIYSDAVWSKLSAGDVRTVNTIQPTDGNITLTGDNINFSTSDTTKVSDKVTSHINNKSNPHAVNLSQLGVTATATELNYVDGVTSNIQTQLNSKAQTSHASSETTYGVGTNTNYGHVKAAIQPSLSNTVKDNEGIATSPYGVISLLSNLQQYWFTAEDTKFASDNINSVVYGKLTFVAVGNNGKGAYSTNGRSWHKISRMNFSTKNINSITFGAEKFVAVGAAGSGIYSANADTWTEISDMKFGSTFINSVTYGNGKFVAVGEYGKGSYSEDGITWTAISDMKFGTGITKLIGGVAYGNGKFVAVGLNGMAYGAYSNDGITWTAISDLGFYTNFAIYAIAYGNGRFVIGAADGEGSYSEDGIHWTRVINMLPNRKYVKSITYGNGKFVAVGDAGVAAYSEDGITWIPINDMKFESTNIKSITYGNGKFIAVGDSGKATYCFSV